MHRAVTRAERGGRTGGSGGAGSSGAAAVGGAAGGALRKRVRINPPPRFPDISQTLGSNRMLRASVLALCLSSASCFSPAAVRPSIATLRLAPLCSRAAAPCAQADSAIVPDSPEPASKPSSLADNLDAVYRFSRPHTIRGTLLACFTGVGRALVESPSFLPMIPALLPKAILGVLALLLGNLFIVGINQIYDVRPAWPTRALPTCQHAPRPLCPARPGASAPRVGLTSQLSRRWRSTRSTSPSSPWPPAASRRRWRGRSSSAQVRALPGERPPRAPPDPGAPCARAAGYS